MKTKREKKEAFAFPEAHAILNLGAFQHYFIGGRVGVILDTAKDGKWKSSSNKLVKLS